MSTETFLYTHRVGKTHKDHGSKDYEEVCGYEDVSDGEFISDHDDDGDDEYYVSTESSKHTTIIRMVRVSPECY